MRTRLFFASWFLGLLSAAAPRKAGAELPLPARSPVASVSQTVGLTQIALEYNSPAVAGRPVWQSVATPGVLWRTGEGIVPKIRFSRDVAVGGQRVAAGTYALLTIPSDGGDWTVILNGDASLVGTADYRPELDLVRVKALAGPSPFRERLTFSFSGLTDEKASLDLEWAERRVSIAIKTFTNEQIGAAIHDLDETWRRYADAARYFYEVKHDREAVLRYIERSLALAEDPYNAAIQAMVGGRGEAPAVSSPAPLVMATIGPSPRLAARFGERPVRVRASALPAKPPGPEEITPVITMGQNEIQTCYQRALRQDPSLSRARITISIDIGVSGFAKNVRLDPPHPAGTLDSCMKDAISHWRFPLSPVEYGTEFPVNLRGTE